jgi:hypothetical protein
LSTRIQFAIWREVCNLDCAAVLELEFDYQQISRFLVIFLPSGHPTAVCAYEHGHVGTRNAAAPACANTVQTSRKREGFQMQPAARGTGGRSSGNGGIGWHARSIGSSPAIAWVRARRGVRKTRVPQAFERCRDSAARVLGGFGTW